MTPSRLRSVLGRVNADSSSTAVIAHVISRLCILSPALGCTQAPVELRRLSKFSVTSLYAVGSLDTETIVDFL
jgi:hypothetical protein